MAQLAYKSFEALAAGGTDADFTAISGTWGAIAGRQTGGSKSYGIQGTINTANADAKFLILTSINGTAVTPQADMSVQFGIQAGRNAGTLLYNMSALARCNSAGTEYIQAFYSPTNDQIQVYYKTAAGSVTQIGTNTSAGLSTANNEILLFKLEVQGTAVRVKVWKQGTAEPGSFQFTGTQTQVTAAGYSGIRTGFSSGTTAPAFDDFYYGDAGETYALPASSDLAVTDAKAYKSHRNFRTKGSGLRTNNSGAEISIKVTGTTSLAIVNDMSSAATNNPLRISINGGPYQAVTMLGWNILASSLTPATTYELRVWVPLLTQAGDKWTAAASNVWDPLRFVADTGATYQVHGRTGQWGLFFFDSLGEYTDALAMIGYNLGVALNLEMGLVAYGGTGLGTNNDGGVPTAVGRVPALSQRYNLLDASTPVDATDVPSMIVIVQGTNDELAGAPSSTTQTAISTINSGLRSMYGASVPIFFCYPVGGQSRSAIAAGVAALSDANTKLVDPGILPNAQVAVAGGTDITFDGIHLNGYGVPRAVGRLAAGIRTARVSVPIPSNVLSTAPAYSDGTTSYTGTATSGYPLLPANKVLSDTNRGDGTFGNVTLPAANKVLAPTQYGASGTQFTGTASSGYPLLPAGKVLTGTDRGDGTFGTLTLPSAGNVKTGSGLYGDPGAPLTPSYSITFPNAGQILQGAVASDGTTTITGTLVLPSVGNVLAPTQYGAGGTQYTGTATTSSGYPLLPAGKVLLGTDRGDGTLGTLTLPLVGNVKAGTGTYGDPGAPRTPSLTITFPTAGQILEGATATDGTVTVNGTYRQPVQSSYLSSGPGYGPGGNTLGTATGGSGGITVQDILNAEVEPGVTWRDAILGADAVLCGPEDDEGFFNRAGTIKRVSSIDDRATVDYAE